MPRQAPIPIWIGATSAPALRRAGRLADGWFPQLQPGAGLEAAKATVDEAAREAGRDPASIGMEGRITLDPPTLDRLDAAVDAWASAGASHLSFNTMRLGLADVDAHLAMLERAAAALGRLGAASRAAEPAPGVKG